MGTTKKVFVNAVSAAHAVKFEQYLRKWQLRLNLMDWRIDLSPTRCKGNMGEIHKSDLAQRQATIRLGESFGPTTKVTDRTLEELAIHELLHVFLLEMSEFLRQNISLEDQQSAEHRVINVLEQQLLGAPV